LKKSPLKYSKTDKDVINRLHLLTGRSFEDCKEIIEGFFIMAMLNYMDDEDPHMRVPLVGDFEFVYEGDVLKDKGRQAKVSLKFNPDDFLLRVIGQIEDGAENEIEKYLKQKNASIFEGFFEEE
jgi:hypothetical protein